MTTVQEKFMDAIKLATSSVALQKKSTRSGLIDVSISRLIKVGHFDFYLETWLSSLADSTMFKNSTVSRIMNDKSFITLINQLVKNTVHVQVQVATVQAHFQNAVRAPHHVEKLELVKLPSLQERSLSR